MDSVFFPKTLYYNFSEVLGGIKSKCMFNFPLYPEIRYSLKGNMLGYQKKKKKSRRKRKKENKRPWIFIRIVLTLNINSGNIEIFTIVSLFIQEHIYSKGLLGLWFTFCYFLT